MRTRIYAEVGKALREKDFADKLAVMGAILRPATMQEFAELLRSEDKRWQAVVANSGAKID